MRDMLDIQLKRVFGYSEFRPDQREIVENILHKKDVFAVMPTGGGKSLCYQLPAIVSEGTGIVVSPLISLMKDQVDGARVLGIRAEYLNSNLSPAEMSDIYRLRENNELDLLYVSPERFAMESFLQSLERINICLFAVDEAHCMSEWGHDFRPDYLNLKIIKERYRGIPIAAFTATATEKVQTDITGRLNLNDPFTVRASFNRPNLYYRVEPKDDVEYQILELIKSHPGEPGIVYRTSRKSVEGTADFLKQNGVKALSYHAGLDKHQRENNQNAFNRDEIQVIVATIAFGMGIDKSNVRFVINADLPKNIEGYYQETGRAGRDGDPSLCVLFFGRGDIPRLRYFIDKIEDDQERRIATDKLYRMADLASVEICRRRQLLGYFGEKYPDNNCGGCDVCLQAFERVDESVAAQKIMSAIARTREAFERDHVIDIITGNKTETVCAHEHDKLPTFGVGQDKEKLWWHELLDELTRRKCVGVAENTLKLTTKGKDVLFGRDKFMMMRKSTKTEHRSAIVKGGRAPALQTEAYDQELFEQLRKLRRDVADRKNVPPYVVFTDKTLHDMARLYPQRRNEMLQVHGVGTAKMSQYGQEFIEEVKMYLEKHPDRVPKGKKVVMSTDALKKAIDFDNKILELAEADYGFPDICRELNLAPSKVSRVLEVDLKNNDKLNIDTLIDPYIRIEIERQLETRGRSLSNTAIAKMFHGAVSLEEIRLVKASTGSE
ncbi:MAG: DNA helicase RecQ [Victivallales bacterium]|nr:DNA helicase RecQ [Victivallales bacterium]